MPKKITAIYVNARKKYSLCIYMYKPENLPAFIHISQKKIFICVYISNCFKKNQISPAVLLVALNSFDCAFTLVANISSYI
jgi:hypothetical protein